MGSGGEGRVSSGGGELSSEQKGERGGLLLLLPLTDRFQHKTAGSTHAVLSAAHETSCSHYSI